MKFNNTVAYCKGFYVSRPGDVFEMWKDMAHCIMCDGWTIFSKQDVARWCLHRLEDFAKEFPKEAWQVSFGAFYDKIEHNRQIIKISQRYHNLNRELDDYDYIIWTFRDFIRYLDGDKFTEGVIPNDIVLPIDKDNISIALWDKITTQYKEQNTTKWYIGTYEEREQSLKD